MQSAGMMRPMRPRSWHSAQQPRLARWHVCLPATPSQLSPASTQGPVELQQIDGHSVRGVVVASCDVVDAVACLAALDTQAAQQLVQLGAVFWGERIKGQGDKVKWRRLMQPHGSPPLPALQPNTLLRCHPQPKRYPACYTSWPERVLHLDEELLIVNKPAGLPCMPHESNGAEEIAGCAGRALGITDLAVGHRLDQWTTGVFVLTRTKQASREFKQALQDKSQVTKVYKALTWLPVPLGTLQHWMYDGPFNQGAPVLGGGNLPPRGPRLLSGSEHPGWRHCSLEVLQCQPCPGAVRWMEQCKPAARGAARLHNPDLGQRADASTGQAGGVLPGVVYESTIQLHTGRTHQIRAQLASIGCALIGDLMYEQIEGVLVGPEGVVHDPELVAHIETLPVLDGHFGLHAWHLAWKQHSFTAPAPWHDPVD